jgi:hypothetical protein
LRRTASRLTDRVPPHRRRSQGCPTKPIALSNLPASCSCTSTYHISTRHSPLPYPIELHRHHGDHFRILPATTTPQSSPSPRTHAGPVFVNSQRQRVYYIAKSTAYAPAALPNFAAHVAGQPVRPTSRPESAWASPADAVQCRRLWRTRNAWVWLVGVSSSSNGNGRCIRPTLLWHAKSEHCHVSRRQSGCAKSSIATTRRYATANATTT